MKTLFVLFFIIILLSGCKSNIKIPIDETKIHNRINNFYLETLNNPETYIPISFSKPDTIFITDNQVKLRIKNQFRTEKGLSKGDWEVTVTRDEIIILPTKEYEKFLLQQ